jgi:hypothetical protein
MIEWYEYEGLPYHVEFIYDSFLALGSEVSWNGETWILRNYSRKNDRAAISKWLADGTMVTEGVIFSELEKQNKSN